MKRGPTVVAELLGALLQQFARSPLQSHIVQTDTSCPLSYGDYMNNPLYSDSGQATLLQSTHRLKDSGSNKHLLLSTTAFP